MTTAKKTPKEIEGRIVESYWNGACYEACASDDVLYVEGEEQETLQEYADSGDWGVDCDITLSLHDADDDEVRTLDILRNKNEAAQDSAEILAKNVGEFSTTFVGVLPGQRQWENQTVAKWSRNGGSVGAHDRMDGSGRWIESYDDPEEITESEAVILLVTDYDLSLAEAVEKLADAVSHDLDREEIAAEVVGEIHGIDSIPEALEIIDG